MTTLPAGWRTIEQRLDGIACEGRGPAKRKLRVIVSVAREDDGNWWCHVSVSARQAPLPTWEEMDWVKRHFIGVDQYAYQVHPPAEQHVNIHPGCLHLWARMDDDLGPGQVLPDFTRGGGSI